MILKNDTMTEQPISRATINSMMEALSQSLMNDIELAKDLLAFLTARNIEIPNLPNPSFSKLIPVSFNQKNNDHQSQNVKSAFEGNDQNEYLL